MNVLDMDATALAAEIEKGNISSEAATQTYIAHLQRVNPQVNCVVEDRYEQALNEAKAYDRQRQEGGIRGRLHGVPISVKECFDVEGMRTTGGLSHLKDRVATSDARVVQQLRQEGAIVLAKTNTPTLCFCQETDNKLYGRTNNPWDLSRTAGGSSGGEGALIAVGGASVGIGADIGGSVRVPCHANGIVGFKSGKEQISSAGNFPDFPSEQRRMLGIGAMAKSVRDAALLHSILSGRSVDAQADALSRMTLVFPHRKAPYPLHASTQSALDRVERSVGQDFSIDHELPPYFIESSLIWQQLMSIDGGKALASLLSEDGSMTPLREYARELLFKNSSLHPYMTWALIGAGLFKPSSRRMGEIVHILREGDALLEQYCADRILIMPVYHRAAPHHGQLYKEIFAINKTFLKYMPYIAYANVWGLPSLTIPVSEDGDGMPIALQLISTAKNESALFQLGKRLEVEFRGYRRCTLYDK